VNPAVARAVNGKSAARASIPAVASFSAGMRHQNAMFPIGAYQGGCSRPATLDLNLVLAALGIWTKLPTRNTLLG
jgi:hypothetical protein